MPNKGDPAALGQTARIVLADPISVSRAGLAAILSKEPGFVVVGESPIGSEAVRLCSELQPDVLVVDVHVSDPGPFELAQIVIDAAPRVRVVVVSDAVDRRFIRLAFRAGVAAYVHWDATDYEIVTTVRRLLREEAAVSGSLFAGQLTARERKVLQLAGEGHTNVAIAQALGLSSHTVNTHFTHINLKLGTRSRADAVVKAVKFGLLEARSSSTG